MNDMQYAKSRLRGWVDSFLKQRGCTAPSGLPLYSYATTDNELQMLSVLLSVCPEERESIISGTYWAAGYCLFVAERYRRQYDANWSWQAFDSELELSLQPIEHKGLVKRGLDFWGRPIRYRAHGADYLGSLFAEGGLPWKLLQSEGHGFGRAIKSGIRHYHECKRDGRDIAQVICEYGQYFPQSFQNEEKYQLLARVIETLMLLAEQHALDEQDDPAAYLNSHYPQWRDEFPLPLEEENGHSLVNEWLRDAGVRLEERKRAEEMARYFTCEHRIDGSIELARLLAEVRLAPSLQVKLDGRKLSTTRVELALYEGDQMVLKLGAAYGRLEGDVLAVKLPAEVVKCRRKSPDKPLFLVCSCAGERLDTHTIQFSEVDWNQLPAVFVEEGDEVYLVGIASVKAKAPEVLLRVPVSMKIEGMPSVAADAEVGFWYRVSQPTIISDAGASYLIEPGSSSAAERVEFQGVLSPYETLPIATWLGWPRCMLASASAEGRRPESYRVNDQVFQSIDSLPLVGSFKVEVLGPDQQVLARRKLGVLPRDFSIASLPASSQVPARISIRTVQGLKVRVLNESLHTEVRREGSTTTVELTPVDQQPDRVLLEISDQRNHADGIVIRLPYPEEGVQLVEDDGSLFRAHDLTLDRILGMSLVMTPPPGRTQTFHLSLELMGRAAGLEKRYTYDVKSTSTQVSLFSLYDDILSLFSCSAEQDAVVRCKIETSRPLKQLDIRRYSAEIRFTGGLGQFFELTDHNLQPLVHRAEGTVVMAMKVQTPEEAPVELQPQSIQSLTTGVFELPARLQKDGPWLLYPAEGSATFFRPALHVPDVAACTPDDGQVIKTLNSAARYYHPRLRPDVFNDVLDDMSVHFLHSSWLYLTELKQRYKHVPLSAFESWKHLSRHPQALALAVFRLEMDARFAERLQQELAVIWEAITVEQWKSALLVYVQGVSQQFGIPEEMVKSSAKSRMGLLSVQVPLFKDFSGELCASEGESIRKVPLEFVLPDWLSKLRMRQEDAQWPVILNEALSNWVRQHEDYAWMRGLEMPGYMRSVFYMPVFAACLTAGVASLSELEAEEAALRFGFRVLSDFDRDGWYGPVYSATLSGLLHAKGSHS
ncbi:hypothetical protein CLV44_11479 [Marinobacterium halophilum]|uniref:Uncharacterized protein n=1 Tax=Marinobacterium halophilum TaxID=267374 RepID=A0A2P8EUF6_9GAMM|nr:STY4851/ECs_5259 family protein [Marinobacterium halophilum]PSL13082.1 hypothetical protein CLV44_11479 [Marinobacterium halophilum]